MMNNSEYQNNKILLKADWEIDFYSRPIIEQDGKKRWELLITNTQDFSSLKQFRWEKRCPANDVNSIWLSLALTEALKDAKDQGWEAPLRLRCWRTSMKTMIKRAATEIGLEVISSRRTYALNEWLAEREKDIYPNEDGYMVGPLAPGPKAILNQPIPLPEAVRGDAWNFTYLSLNILKEADTWPIEFGGLLPIKENSDDSIEIPGLRLFSKKRALALAGWLGGLEPVRLLIEGNQLLLEAGQEDRWIVTEINNEIAKVVEESFINSRKNANGIQFIAVQANPDSERFEGFWMLKDINY